MLKTEFIRLCNVYGTEYAVFEATAYGISLTQIELWRNTK